MKEKHQAVPAVVCVCPDFKRFSGILIILLFLGGNMLFGQCRLNEAIFAPGEEIHFEVYFKWGLIMPRAGSAVMSVKNVQFNGDDAIRQRLTFRTASFFDKIYKMRDTVDTHYSTDFIPLHYSKRADEDDYFLVDEMTFLYKNGKTIVPTKRYDRNRTKIDTTHVVDGFLFDVLGVTMYLRGIDLTNVSIGDEFPAFFAMGRDVVKIKYRYGGQSIVERSENLKYRTLKFYMDVYDDAVSQTKDALEIWISDDENRIPIKMRAKLKIGAAEAYFVKVKGNRYPFTSQVRIPVR